MRDAHDQSKNDDMLWQDGAPAKWPGDVRSGEPSLPGMHQARIAKKLDAVDEQVANLQNAVRSAIADVEYALRRAEADLMHANRFAIEEFAKSLLPFKDSLEAALMIRTTDVHALRSGLALTLKLLQVAFEKNGLIELPTRPGDRFDPHKHRLLAKADDLALNPAVASVEQKGYAINGRMIRPVAVTIAPMN